MKGRVVLGLLVSLAMAALCGAVQEIAIDTGDEKVTVAKEDLDKGEGVFTKHCATCHSNAEMVRKNPTMNLTDHSWIHGQKLSEIERTIREGVPDTDMAPMKDKLLPREVRQVARYVLFVAYRNKER